MQDAIRLINAAIASAAVADSPVVLMRPSTFAQVMTSAPMLIRMEQAPLGRYVPVYTDPKGRRHVMRITSELYSRLPVKTWRSMCAQPA